MPDLLIELLSEEIPARMQEFAANELKKNMLSFLADQGVSEIAATDRKAWKDMYTNCC